LGSDCDLDHEADHPRAPGLTRQWIATFVTLIERRPVEKARRRRAFFLGVPVAW
jgi:hypothetical protein